MFLLRKTGENIDMEGWMAEFRSQLILETIQ